MFGTHACFREGNNFARNQRLEDVIELVVQGANSSRSYWIIRLEFLWVKGRARALPSGFCLRDSHVPRLWQVIGSVNPEH
jgi:hypothetical protein